MSWEGFPSEIIPRQKPNWLRRTINEARLESSTVVYIYLAPSRTHGVGVSLFRCLRRSVPRPAPLQDQCWVSLHVLLVCLTSWSASPLECLMTYLLLVFCEVCSLGQKPPYRQTAGGHVGPNRARLARGNASAKVLEKRGTALPKWKRKIRLRRLCQSRHRVLSSGVSFFWLAFIRKIRQWQPMFPPQLTRPWSLLLLINLLAQGQPGDINMLWNVPVFGH